MRIAVIGTGTVGRALAARLADLGHEVTVGTRDVQATLTRTSPGRTTNQRYAAWAADHPTVQLATLADAAKQAELLVNATPGTASIPALQAAAAENLKGKILLDIANPLDFSQGFPPTLFVKDTDSLGEQIQATFPDLKVVKALNTLAADLMVHPHHLDNGDHTVFVSGNDAEAKKTVTALLESFGHTDIIDLGDITNARGAEMLIPIGFRLMSALPTPVFNFKIVR